MKTVFTSGQISVLLLGIGACSSVEQQGGTSTAAPIDASARQVETNLRPPSAKVIPTELVKHGHTRVDDYFWMKERDHPDVLSYLKAENQFTKASMAHTEGMQETLFKEIRGRIKQADQSAPYEQDGYWYYRRTEDGKDYPLYCRKQGTLEAEEQILLDVNSLGEEGGYCGVGGRAVSTDGKLYAFGVDRVGRRFYTLGIKNLETGAMLDDRIESVTSNVVWANDNRTLFYTKQDPTTLRSFQIWRHVVGADASTDSLIYQEDDETFRCYVSKTKSKRYLLISSTQTLSAEVRYLDADKPNGKFQIFMPRERGHEYRVDHYADHFYVRTNDEAENFKLVRTPLASHARESWEEVIPHSSDVLLQGIEVFADHMVVNERAQGLVRFRVIPWSGEGEHTIAFEEPAYRAGLRNNPSFDTSVLRFSYSSLTTPSSVYDYDMRTRERELVKRDEVLGDFDPVNYRTERHMAKARDGTRVPVSLVYRTGTELDGSNPLLLSGYGSYGSSRDASFNPNLLSLLDRGFVYAIAHIRGGSEMGRAWYENGKLFNKKNTFTDFIDSAEFLVSAGYTAPDRLFAAGGSAGGLLIGAVANMRPNLFRGLMAGVPFVDVITTMLDSSIPLTTSEYDEWGNPNEKAAYEYILSYSPYDQVREQKYPNLLVTTGYHDSQVQYWEPAKWVAKLRANKLDENRLLLKTNMEAGHGGASSRDQRYKDTAFQYAFLLDLVPGFVQP